MSLIRFFCLFSIFSIVFAHETLDPRLSNRPLVVESAENIDTQFKKFNKVGLQCSSWKFAADTNNLSPWKTIPKECAGYIKRYIIGRAYATELARVSYEAGQFASSFKVAGDGKDVWVFDIDETLLSNLPYYHDHGYGLEIFDSEKFDKWVEKGSAPAIKASLKVYKKVVELGFKVFLLTGRTERHRLITVKNLIHVGFHEWDKLILKGPNDHGKSATVFKSEKRDEMVKEGYRIIGNSGDQWSDLLGSSISHRSFKLPNPMYYLP